MELRHQDQGLTARQAPRDENSYSGNLHELRVEWVVVGWFPWQLSAFLPKDASKGSFDSMAKAPSAGEGEGVCSTR